MVASPRPAEIRGLELTDVSAVLSIQAESPELAQWTRLDYARIASAGMTGWVAECDGQIVGFMISRRVADEVEILNIAISARARRQGIGSKLIRHAMRWALRLQAAKIYLEVRESNAAAQQFYCRHGFTIVGRRVRYYSSPKEDALIFAAQIETSKF